MDTQKRTRAVLYARISADDRRYASSSIQSQLDDCRAYAEQHGYHIVGEVFEDPRRFTSGRDWLPGLLDVLRMAGQHQFDVLVARDTDRLARDVVKATAIEVDLEKHGVVVEFVRGNYERTAEGDLLKNVKRSFDQYEAAKIRQRMVDGQVRSVASGNVKVSNNPPYGYRVVQQGKTRTFEVVEADATIVRTIYDLYCNQAETLYGIAKYLNDRMIPKPASAGTGWSHGTLLNILTNETYVGRWYYGKHGLVKDPQTGKKIRVDRPREEWMLVEVPAIIDEATFQTAQQQRQSNKRRGQSHVNFYVLGGLIRCGHCGASMTGLTRKDRGGKQYYVCIRRFGHDRHPQTTRCSSPYHPVQEVDQAVWGWVKAVLLNPPRLRAELAKYQESLETETTPLASLLTSSQAKLDGLLQEKDRLIKAYMEGILNLDEMAAQKVELDERIQDVTRAVETLAVDLEQQRQHHVDVASIERLVAERARDIRLTDDDPQAQREIYLKLGMQVTLGEAAGNRWAEVTCALGRFHVLTRFTEAGWFDHGLTIRTVVAASN